MTCCDLHNKNCEPPGDLCCGDCTEVNHPDHPAGESCTWVIGRPAVNVDPIEQVTNSVISHAAATIVTASEKPGSTPRHWASALWRAGMLVPPAHSCRANAPVEASVEFFSGNLPVTDELVERVAVAIYSSRNPGHHLGEATRLSRASYVAAAKATIGAMTSAEEPLR